MLKYRLRTIGRKKAIFWSATILIFIISITSIVRYYAISHPISAVTESNTNGSSGIYDNKVIVNDLDSDWYYYESLNYTQVTNRDTLPTYSNRYNSNNLIAVQITYSGSDVAGKTAGNNVIKGNVDYSNQYSDFVYYKYYPVSNNKITIELPDNLYTMRPTGYGFNGWYCDPAKVASADNNGVSCDRMNFYLDTQYYTRYLEVSNIAAGTDYLTINLNASWVDARINTNYATGNNNAFGNSGGLLNYGMHPIDDTKDVNVTNHMVPSFKYKDYNDQYINQTGIYYIDQIRNNSNVPNGAYLITDLANLVATNQNRCENSPGGCYIFRMMGTNNNPENLTHNATYDYNPNTTYYQAGETNNEVTPATTQFNVADPNGDWHSPRHKNSPELNVTQGRIYDENDNEVTGLGLQNVSFGNEAWNSTRNLAGYYYLENIGNRERSRYVNASGQNCSRSGVSCNNGSTYRRLEVGDPEANWEVKEYTIEFDGYESVEPVKVYLPSRPTTAIEMDKYHILTTRDTNIIEVNSTVYLGIAVGNRNRPFTITSNHDGQKVTSAVLYTGTNNRAPNTNFNAGSDMVIENINFAPIQTPRDSDWNTGLNSEKPNLGTNTASILIYSGTTSTSSSYNVKIGRLVQKSSNATNNNYVTNTHVVGGRNKKLIVESGFYNTGESLPVTFSTSNNHMISVWGSDFDRAVGNNTRLIFQYQIAGCNFDSSQDHTTNSTSVPISHMIVKSGSYGYRYLLNIANAGYASGVYVGGLGNSYATIEGIMEMTIEGGRIFCVNGGPTIDDNYHGVYINLHVKGGLIDSITGGAGATGTNGDRIVSVSSGTILNSVAGGSNSSQGGTSPGPMADDTLVYVGGNTIVGGETFNNLFAVHAGDVFGAGLGRNGYANYGVVTNSHVIINGDPSSTFDIKGNVYGGGNYGSTGTQAYNQTTTKVEIINGKISGSVFGGANNAGAGRSDSYRNTITIDMTGGTVSGSVYGGSNTTGTVNGQVTLNMTGGTVTNDIFGGGYGDATTITRNVEVKIDGITARDVYGGSALGRVNGTANGTGNSSYTTKVTVDSGTVNDVYGCGQGGTNNQGNAYNNPYTNGATTVTINGGTARNVYGGNNISGTAAYATNVILNGGTITQNAYGGGNNVGHNTTNIKLQGTTITGNLFGGSNEKGTVNQANVTVESGPVTNIFGGNNLGGNAVVTNVVINGITYVNGDIYGGGNEASSGTTNVTLNNNLTIKDSNNNLRSVYGGGLAGSVTTSTNVLIKNGTMKEVYGGTNTSQDVARSNVYITNGNFKNVYGGNNVSGTTNNAYVYIGNGTIHDVDDEDNAVGGVYGGGRMAPSGNTYVYTYNGTMDNIFGGGSMANITGTTHVNMYGGSTTDVYGGSNTSGTVNQTIVNITNTVEQCTAGNNIVQNPCYGRGNRTVTDVYGGNNAGGTSNTTFVNIYTGSTLNDVFGGGNNAVTLSSTTVRVFDGTVKNVYGGGNKSFVGDAAEVNGNFSHGIGDPGNTYVYVARGTINENVYGSGNASFVYGDTHVYVGDQAKTALNSYQGNSVPNNATITINGSVFGGSETNAKEGTRYDDSYVGVQGDTFVYVEANTYNKTNITIARSLFGGGNNSKVCDSCTSNIYVKDYGTDTAIKKLLSIQRVKNVYIQNSVLLLDGDRDRALPTMYLYGFIRVGNLYVLGTDNTHGTTLHMRYGNYKLSGYNSGNMNTTNLDLYNASHFQPQLTTVENGVPNIQRSNNRLFLRPSVIFAVANDEPKYVNNTSVPEKVKGMTYLGMYDGEIGSIDYGMYRSNLTNHANVSTLNKFDDSYSFVYGMHEDVYSTQIKTNGFYSHFLDEDNTNIINVDYVGVTPLNATYYKWILGKEKLQIRLTLQATKSTAKGAQLATIDLDELKDVIDDEGHTQDWRDATMTINYVDTSQFKASSGVKGTWDAELVDKTQIKAVNEDTMTVHSQEYGNTTVSEANKYFALSMGTTTSGWLDNYKTNFYDLGKAPSASGCSPEEGEVKGECTGDMEYQYDSTAIGRSLSFWLYYSKNLDFDVSTAGPNEEIVVIPLGEVKINTTFVNPHGDTSSTMGVREVEIFVEVAMVDNKLSTYGAAITAGKQYDSFESSPPLIAADGAFSIYQMVSINLYPDSEALTSEEKWSANELYSVQNVVTENGHTVTYSEAYRYLKSNYVFPVGTKITMLDLKTGEQYYYDVDNTKYTALLQQYTDSDDDPDKRVVQYKLEDFIKMGSTSTTNKYDDDMHGNASTKYYSNIDGTEVAVEEFIFQVDFSGANQAQVDDTRDLYLYMELAKDISSDGNVYTEPMIIPAGTPVTDMKYNIYKNVSSEIVTTGGFVTEDSDELLNNISIYKSETATLELSTNLATNGPNGETISDTKYEDYRLGAKITILKKDGSGNYEPIDDLFGTVASIDNGITVSEYYPQTDGSIRLKLAGRVTDVISDIQLDFSNSNLTFGDYKLVVETFASYDGLYYGDFSPEVNEFLFTLMNDDYGINVTLPAIQVTHDVNNGQDKAGSREMEFALQTKNGLAHPNVKVHLERRTYNDVYETTYEKISMDGIVESIGIGDNNALNSCAGNLPNGGDCYLYNLVSNLDNTLVVQDFTVKMKLNAGPSTTDLQNMAQARWKSGTYRVVFTMYDGSTPIGYVYEYLIIRSLDIDEEVEGS